MLQRAVPVRVSECRTNDVLFQVGGVWRKAEIKFDVRFQSTGNLAVEHSNPKKGVPTGLAASTSDLWCYVLGDEVWVCPTGRFKAFFERTEGVREVTSPSGNAACRLYRGADLLGPVFTRVDHLHELPLGLLLLDLFGGGGGPPPSGGWGGAPDDILPF